jgi:hypothetical protein
VENLLFVARWVRNGQVVRSGLDVKEGNWLSWLEGNPFRKLHGSINKRERLSYKHHFYHIEYILLCKVYCRYSMIHVKLHKSDVA